MGNRTVYALNLQEAIFLCYSELSSRKADVVGERDKWRGKERVSRSDRERESGMERDGEGGVATVSE